MIIYAASFLKHYTCQSLLENLLRISRMCANFGLLITRFVWVILIFVYIFANTPSTHYHNYSKYAQEIARCICWAWLARACGRFIPFYHINFNQRCQIFQLMFLSKCLIVSGCPIISSWSFEIHVYVTILLVCTTYKSTFRNITIKILIC